MPQTIARPSIAKLKRVVLFSFCSCLALQSLLSQEMPPPKPKTDATKNTAAPPVASKPQGANAGPAILLIVDQDCSIEFDGKRLGSFKKGESKTISASRGEHILIAKSTDGGSEWKKTVDLKDNSQVIVSTLLDRSSLTPGQHVTIGCESVTLYANRAKNRKTLGVLHKGDTVEIVVWAQDEAVVKRDEEVGYLDSNCLD